MGPSSALSVGVQLLSMPEHVLRHAKPLSATAITNQINLWPRVRLSHYLWSDTTLAINQQALSPIISVENEETRAQI
jgi:hypothetical protein